MKEINGFKVPEYRDLYYKLDISPTGIWQMSEIFNREGRPVQYYYALAADKVLFMTKEEAQKEADSRNKRIEKVLKPKRWVPETHEGYFTLLGNGTVVKEIYRWGSQDRISIGNCFKTEAEALKVAAKFKTWLLAETEPK